MTVVSESATIVNALRSGLVPAQGLEHFATGLDPLLAAVNEELDFVATGKGTAKWLRGEYGTGKTFAGTCQRLWESSCWHSVNRIL